MIYFKLFLIATLIASPLITISEIDKPRVPVTRYTAVLSVIINGLIIAGVIYFF